MQRATAYRWRARTWPGVALHDGYAARAAATASSMSAFSPTSVVASAFPEHGSTEV